ncbi:MAG: hypothetical protein AAFO15_02000 [Pseudomonadota bacterium]
MNKLSEFDNFYYIRKFHDFNDIEMYNTHHQKIGINMDNKEYITYITYRGIELTLTRFYDDNPSEQYLTVSNNNYVFYERHMNENGAMDDGIYTNENILDQLILDNNNLNHFMHIMN